ncbi:MAG: IPExxxVDY family protein [Crocinitomicaceae bacterium]|nr:IPExxxVDY family protein [Crocinitomicaceae bacterium]MBK8927487.1 IPExxxVDY family protein [Crocinitomicaceae bacterium]
MPKYKLDFENEPDFELIGICSPVADYRLCWILNNFLGINLEKKQDFSTINKKEKESSHSFYQFTHEDGTEFYLIKNLSSAFTHLVPEMNQIDYFILIKNNVQLDSAELSDKLKQVDQFSVVIDIDPFELKSKENFMF